MSVKSKNKPTIVKPEALDQASYTVLFPLLHDGERYKPGDVVTLDEDAAATLIGLNVVAPAIASTPAPAPAVAPEPATPPTA